VVAILPPNPIGGNGGDGANGTTITGDTVLRVKGGRTLGRTLSLI
jgi:hypothetical protein